MNSLKDINFNIYQDILQTIKHNNFKRLENIVKKNLSKKEKVSNGLIEGLNNKIKSIKRTAFGYSNFNNLESVYWHKQGLFQ